MFEKLRYFVLLIIMIPTFRILASGRRSFIKATVGKMRGNGLGTRGSMLSRRSASTTRRATSSEVIESLPNEAGYADEYTNSELISIRVTQKKFTINEDATRDCIRRISEYLGVGDFQVDLWYCSEEKIREFNGEWRGKRKSTDVLSFPANEFVRPGVFDENDPTLQHMKHLGDIIVAPAYIHRVSERDMKYFEMSGIYDDDDDAGVSKAMAREFRLDRRIDLLLIHSMLHLVGYDHETNADWKEMTEKEEEVITALKM